MTTQIIISDIIIHQDEEGRYSVNDLHKASGGEQRHRPKYWLESQQTKELIEAIIKGGNPPFCKNTGNPVFNPVATRRGCAGGTYVCKELVYSYAMWINADFSLLVIRTYDAIMTAPAPKTTVDERTPLRDAVNLLVSKRALPYDQAYAIIHQRFSVSSIEELEPETLPAAIEYIHRLALEGELLPREVPAAPAQLMPIFPPDADFKMLTTIRKGIPVSVEIVPHGKVLMHPSDAVEMLKRQGVIAIHHEKLSSLVAAQIMSLCNAARKEEASWGKIYSSR